MVGVRRGRHPRGGFVQRPAAVDVLDARQLGGRGVPSGPHGAGRARRQTVHVPAEHSGPVPVVPRQDPLQLGALAVIGTALLHRAASAQVRGADGDRSAGRGADPPTLLRARMDRERLVVRGPDELAGEDGDPEGATTPRPDARNRGTPHEDGGETQPVAGPTGQPFGVAAAGLVERHGLSVLLEDLPGGLGHDGRVGGPGVAAGHAGQAEVHLQHRVRGAGLLHGRRRGRGRDRTEGGEGRNGQREERGRLSHGGS